MKRIHLTLLFIAIITLTFLGACIDKNYDLGHISDEGAITPSFTAPVGSLKKSVAEILKDIGIDDRQDLIVVEHDTIYIMYRDTLSFASTGNADKMLSAPTLAIPVNFLHNVLAESHSFQIPIPKDDNWAVSLDSAQLIGSAIKVHVKSKLKTAATFTLGLENGLEYAEPNGGVIQIQPKETGKDYLLKLKDHTVLRLGNSGGNNPHYTFGIKTELATTETLSPINNVELEISFESFNLEIVWGNFNEVTFQEIATSRYFGIFNALKKTASTLQFSDPSIKCDIYNYIGLGGTLTIDHIETAAGNAPVHQAIFDGNKKTYNITLEQSQKPNTSAGRKTVQFDKNNGQIDQLFFGDKHPDSIRYAFSFQSNDAPGFLVVKDSKYIDVIAEARLPLTFNAGTVFNNNDTLDMDLSGSGPIQDIGNIVLWFDYENRFRVGVDLNIKFLDEKGNELPTLARHEKMEAAQWTNVANAQPKQGTIRIDFDEDILNDLRKTRRIVLATQTKTSGQQTGVSIHPQDYFQVGLSVYSKFEIK
jgi:hypothetical protein